MGRPRAQSRERAAGLGLHGPDGDAVGVGDLDLALLDEVQQQIERMKAQQQSTATGAKTQVQGQPFVQSKP